jgi:hypothetical protein
MLLWADNDTTQGLLHLGFQLSREGESIILSQIVDGEPVIIDSITYAEQLTDVSLGRFPDGSRNWYSFAAPTPGFNNIITNSEAEHPNTPEFFKLYQNYPNPFNPRTSIEFSVPETQLITLKIYNIVGQAVLTLVEEKLTPGDYKYIWNAGSFASGVYFYRFETDGGFVQTKKLILLK